MASPDWQQVATVLRPFVARRVATGDVDDVLQDVWLRLQRGLPALRDEDRFDAWLFQVTRSAIGDHLRQRQRHPVPAEPVAEPVPADEPAAPDDDRLAARAMASCLTSFVARLPSPYREAVTLVELEGLTAREAAAMTGISVSGMKSRVQRGRAQLRELLEACCAIALDARGKVVDFMPHSAPAPCGCGDQRATASGESTGRR